MKNLSIALKNQSGALAEVGEVLGRAEVSIEGGGAFVLDGKGVANFLFEDGIAARRALEKAGIQVLQESDVLVQRLNQDQPGQLGKLLRRMADAGINVEVQYSDHDHQLILVVDDIESARSVSEAWERERGLTHPSTESAQESTRRSITKRHSYAAQIIWTGCSGEGTKSYTSYQRDYVIEVNGKSRIDGSSDPAFRGDAKRYNPEELLVASLSSCHMLWYLHLCSINGVVVLGYEDKASGIMEENSSGAGAFVQVELNPIVTVGPGSDLAEAELLHDAAHRNCFIANSVNFPVHVKPRVILSGV